MRLFIGLLITLLSGCTLIRFETSTSYPPSDRVLTLPSGLTIESTGTAFLSVLNLQSGDFFPAAFRLTTKDQIIYVDPLTVANPIPADVILFTHAHDDHYSPADVEKLLTPTTHLIVPSGFVRKVTRDFPDHTIRPMSVGETLVLSDQLKIEAVEAYNVKAHWFSLRIHKPGNKHIGWLITSGDEVIYHAGDTDFIPEMTTLAKRQVDIALLPIGVGATAMTPEQAAQAALAINAKTVVPMHFTLGEQQLDEFLSRLQDTQKVFVFVDD